MPHFLLAFLVAIPLQNFTLAHLTNEQFRITEYLYTTAIEESIPPEKLLLLAECESRFETDRVGDKNKICEATGNPMRSRGLFQINDCYWPEVSDKQAEDYKWATNWAVDKIKKGKVNIWWWCSKESGFK
jgi:hypothetical protein